MAIHASGPWGQSLCTLTDIDPWVLLDSGKMSHQNPVWLWSFLLGRDCVTSNNISLAKASHVIRSHCLYGTEDCFHRLRPGRANGCHRLKCIRKSWLKVPQADGVLDLGPCCPTVLFKLVKVPDCFLITILSFSTREATAG